MSDKRDEAKKALSLYLSGMGPMPSKKELDEAFYALDDWLASGGMKKSSVIGDKS